MTRAVRKSQKIKIPQNEKKIVKLQKKIDESHVEL